MDRLTTRLHNGYLFNLPSINDKKAQEEYIDKVSNKLGVCEDAEEQGLLLKLPCKVGTTVYVFLPNDSHFTKAQINKIEIKPTVYGKMCYFIEPVAHRGSLYRFYENDFGKTVFLTQDEAEEALKRMEESK